MKFLRISALAFAVASLTDISAQAGPNDPPFTKRMFISNGLCSNMVYEMKHWAAGADQWAAFATPTVPNGTPRCGPNRVRGIDATAAGAHTRLGAIIRAENKCNRNRPAGMGPCVVVGLVQNY